MKLVKAVVAVTAALCAVPAQAQSCWTEAAYEAAQVRDFETMMMVSMLRCRLAGNDFTESYNRFVREKRVVLDGVNGELREQFGRMVGKAQALNAYDDYMTKIANSYGAGNDGLNCTDYQAIAAAAVNAPASRAAVVMLANEAGASPRLPGSRCGTTIAMKAGE